MEAAAKVTSAEESADQRILRKLRRSQSTYLKERAKKGEPWIPTQRLPRALTTSASAVRKLERMGEIQGMSVQRQRLHEQQVCVYSQGKKYAVVLLFY
jgi:N12 class adenine-specific DNA methylase